MEIEIDLHKSVDENAGIYFDLSKKAKKKLEGAKAALADSKKKLAELQKQESKFWEEEEKKRLEKEAKAARPKEWYEKFHWFISSEGYLCIGGKDATTNEIIIKKHLDKDDLVFHTEMSGSPFFVIKDGQKASDITLNEAAQAAAIYSRAWKGGYTQAEVFSVLPEQVSKEARSGEFIAKGSFMVYGKKTSYQPKLECAIGLIEEKLIVGGPVSAVQKQTAHYYIIIPGHEKKSELGKKLIRLLKGGDLDDIIKFLPGEGEIKKR